MKHMQWKAQGKLWIRAAFRSEFATVRIKAALSALLMLGVAIFPGMVAAGAEEAVTGPYYFAPDEAVATTTNLPDSFLIGDADGIRVGVDGVYYIHAVGVVPGDVFTKRLTIQNLDQGSESYLPYTLAMRAEPLFSNGPVDLLDVVDLELKLDGRVIYSGRVRGDEDVNMIENALPLGVYTPGDQKTLDIKLTVGTDWELTREKSVAEFKWLFYAWRETPKEPPNTGLSEYGIFIIFGGVALLWVFIILKKKKRRDEDQVALERQS